MGQGHYAAFLSEFGNRTVEPTLSNVSWGLWYSLTILGILGAHEMGHYLACRIYKVDATLPYFLPLPPPFWTGTLGAVIRIREAFPTRTVLFDVGVAGPIAGFAALIPALLYGLSLSTIVPAPPESAELIYLGEPLLFKGAAWLMFGTVPEGYTLNMHPMVFASWFGMLATALNLLPFGQLDGGHITYATLGRWSTPISLATVATAVCDTVATASPGPIPRPRSASASASVPLATPTACPTPIYVANSASKAATSLPRMYQPLASARATAASMSALRAR